MEFIIRDFRPSDAPAVNALALTAFKEYQEHCSDWSASSRTLSNTASLAEHGEIVIAESDRLIVGAVAYIGPSEPKSSFFEPQWSVMRMLVVSPADRGAGIGRALAEECIERARRDGASVFALHTASIMRVAQPMYERMGFELLREAPDIYGVSYAIYIKRLGA